MCSWLLKKIYVKMKIIKEDEPICVHLITEKDKCEDEDN